MYEYWFLGLENPQTGTTRDFLEVLCQMSRATSPVIASQFIELLLEDKKNDLTFLRVTDWKFEFTTGDGTLIRVHHDI